MEIISRSAAKAAGLTRYYTGIPCPAGHDSLRMVSGYKCHECALQADRRKSRDGTRTDADRAKARAYYHANREHILDWHKNKRAMTAPST